MAARRLQAIFRSGAADGEQAKEERRLREEQVKKEEERRRAWDLTGEAERSSCEQEGRKGGVEGREGVDTIDPARWSDLVYNYGGNSNPAQMRSTQQRSVALSFARPARRRARKARSSPTRSSRSS
ncbi:hypothetical protein DFH11DRAFT_1639606, partial [Phellopilus nigrolimitatus]